MIMIIDEDTVYMTFRSLMYTLDVQKYTYSLSCVT